MPKRPGRRELATQTFLDVGREVGAAAVMFHTVIAEHQGLSAVEEKALDLIARFGPLTAGELATRSGLAPASITGLLDRLERKGFIRRASDPEDGRRVRAHLVPESTQAFIPLFTDFVAGLKALCARYSVEDLELVARFMREATQVQLDATAKLAARSPVRRGARPP